ncbi:MAG: Rrf2 family transcriptional regulator [Chloroflexi bacterium]|nr:Rrf2 family transcriptional regulator [Chloroflexota bacterium]
MKISTKGEYGTRALLELARYYGKGPLQSSQIADRQQIPENYLNQLLIILRRAGLIQSIRGPQGGHQLSRPPAEINLAEALRALEGPTAPRDCVEEGIQDCSLYDICAIRDVWYDVKQATDRVLNAVTLEALSHRQEKRNQAATQPQEITLYT